MAAGEDLLGRLQTALSDLEGKLEAADRALNALSEGIDFPEVLGETLEGLQATVDQLKGQLPEAIRYNTESIVALHAQVATLEEGLAAVPVGDAGSLPDTAGLSESTIAELAELRQGLEQLQQELANQDSAAIPTAIEQVQQDLEKAITLQTSERAHLQEQLAELKLQVASTGEIFNTVDSLQSSLGQLERQIEREVADTTALRSAVETLKETSQALETRLSEAVVDSPQEDDSGAIVQLQAEVTRLTEELTAVAEKQDREEISQLQQDVTQLAQRLDGLVAQDALENLRTTVSEYASNLEDVRQQLPNLDLPENLPESVAQNRQSIDRLLGQEEAIAELQQSLTELDDRLQELSALDTSKWQADLSELQAAHSQLETQAETGIEELQTSVAGLSAQLDSLNQQLPEAVAYNTQSIVSLHEQLANLETPLSQAEERLEQIRTDLQSRASNDDLEDVRLKVEEVQSGLAAVSESQANTDSQEEFGSIRSQIDALNEQLTATAQIAQSTAEPLVEQVQELQQKLEGLSVPEDLGSQLDAIAHLEAAIARLESAQTERDEELTEGLKPPVGEVQSLQAEILGLSARLDRLHEQLPEAIAYNTQSIVRLHEQLTSLETTVTQSNGAPSSETETARDIGNDGAARDKTDIDETNSDKSVPTRDDAIARLEKSLAQTNERLNASQTAREQLETLQIVYEDIEKRMDAVDVVVASNRAIEQHLNGMQADLSTRAASTELEEVRALLRGFAEAIETSEQQLQQLQTHLESRTAEADFQEALQQLNQLQTQVGDHAEQLAEPGWKGEMESLQAAIAGLEEQIPSEDISRIETQLVLLEQQLGDHPADPTGLEAISQSQQQLQEQLERLQEQQENQASASQLTDANLRSFGQDLSRLAERVEQLPKALLTSPSAPLEPQTLGSATVNLESTELESAEPGSGELESNSSEGNDLKLEWRSALAATEARLAALQAQVEEIQTSTDTPDNSEEVLQPIMQKSSELENQLSTFATTLYALQTTVTPLEQQLPETLRHSAQSIADIQEQLESLQEQQETLQSQQSTLQQQLQSDSQLETDDLLNSLQADCQQLRDLWESDRQEIENSVQTLTAMQAKLDNLQQQQATLQEQLQSSSQSQGDLLQTLQAEGQHLRELLDSDREAVQDIQQALAALELKQVNTLPADAIAPLAAQLDAKASLANQQELEGEIERVSTLLAQLEQQLPEAIRCNTGSLLTLQTSIAGVESQLTSSKQDEDSNRDRIEQLQVDVERLLGQQQSLKWGLWSSVGVAIAAMAVAASQFFTLPSF